MIKNLNIQSKVAVFTSSQCNRQRFNYCILNNLINKQEEEEVGYKRVVVG